MNIDLIDETGQYPHTQALERAIELFLSEQGLHDREVTVVLMDDATIAERNEADRGVEGPTDVLSYPTFEPDDEGFPEVPHLGDVLVSLDTAARQAPEHGHDLHHEVLVLVAHGITHLLGYDHQTDEDWATFNTNQARMLQLAAGQ